MDAREALNKALEGRTRAFPFIVQLANGFVLQPGMDLRDWFAGQATEEDIQEFMPQTMGAAAEFKMSKGFLCTRAYARYLHADAMMEARKQEASE